MKRVHIQSEAIKSLGYDEKKQILEIEFHEPGVIWQYLDVGKYEIKKLLDSESRGNYFTTHIKGKYAEKRVEE